MRQSATPSESRPPQAALTPRGASFQHTFRQAFKRLVLWAAHPLCEQPCFVQNLVQKAGADQA